MTIDVLIFGPLAAAAGARKLATSAPLDTAGSLRSALVEQHPDLARHIKVARFAVNQEFVPDSARILPTDEVALIGAVSGG